MAQRQTKEEKRTDARIDRLYREHCSGIQVDIFDLSKITAEGRRIAATGADDAALGAGIRAFVETIRKN